MLFCRVLFISSIILLISLNFVNSNGHQGHHPQGHHHSRHSSSEHRIQREHGHHGGGGGGGAHPSSAQHFPGHQPFAGGHCGCSASNVHHVTPQNGIPIFLFPDHAQKAVDVILGAEGAFYWDNDELAHRVFDLLAHKFPQKWFMVGVGNSPSNGLGFRLLKGQRQDLLHGTIKVSPGHSPFAFFDRRQFPRENETELWYFVRAVDPIEAEEGAETNSNKIQKKLTECVRKETKSCIPASLASICSLDFLALIEQHNTQPAIYASEPMQMKVLNMITQCTAENEGTRFYAVMTAANEEQNE